MDMIVRRAELLDIEEMAMIDEKCFSVPWSADAFHRELTKNKIAFYIVAEIGGFVVAYAGLWRVEDEGHITNVAVLPEYRGLHIASALLEVMFDTCAREGIVDYTLEVRRSNAPARLLYEKHGFRNEGVRPGYYQDDKEDALIKWRRGNNNDQG